MLSKLQFLKQFKRKKKNHLHNIFVTLSVYSKNGLFPIYFACSPLCPLSPGSPAAFQNQIHLTQIGKLATLNNVK